MADLVYTGRFDLNPARNTREKLLLPLADIKPLQEPGVYIAVMNQAGRYSYSNAATLFTQRYRRIRAPLSQPAGCLYPEPGKRRGAVRYRCSC